MDSTLQKPGLVLGESQQPNWPDLFGEEVNSWAKQMVKEPIRTLSLFSGAGGLDIGFHDAGFQVHTMIEVNQQFVNTLRANCGINKYFSACEPICLDIRKYRVPKSMSIDFIIGGPPCQPFSAAARRMAGVRGTLDKERGELFRQYVRLLERLSPKGFLFENVYGLTSAEGGKAWKKIKRAFEKAGYRVFFQVMDAADYGVPQHRKRVFIVGTKDVNYLFPKPTHGPESPEKTPYVGAGEAIRGLSLARSEIVRVNGRYGKLLNDIPAGLNYSFYTQKLGHPRPVFAWRSKFYDFLYKADPKAPIRTLMAQRGQYSGPFHWGNRRFSIAELKRLQTIPDKYELTGGSPSMIRQIGNSVPPQLARILALSILNQVFGFQLPFTLPLLQDNQSLGVAPRKRLKRYSRRTKAAINRVSRNHIKRRPRKRSYTAALTHNFELTRKIKEREALVVSFTPLRTEWRIEVSSGTKNASMFEIVIASKPKTWGLDVACVILAGNKLSPLTFTGAWKAFEAELVRLGIKADLVQLRGYYQYKSTFHCSMKFIDVTQNKREWKIVGNVVGGMGVGKILSYKKFSNLWRVSEKRVIHYANFLRNLGYEVRNSNTNPQIPQNHILIPYPFPTLNPMSVQLHKSL